MLKQSSKIFFFVFVFLALFFVAFPSLAYECYQDPIYERDWWGKYKIAAYVLERACSGTTKLEVVPAGTILHIIAETDGWYKVETLKGNIGWTGARLIELVNKPSNAEEIYQNAKTVEETTQKTENNNYDWNLIEHVKGRLLLQVEEHGEIWYVSPVTGKRYLVTVKNALPLFRSLALGITNADLAKIPKYNEYNHQYNLTLRNRVKGRLLLAVEDHGRVWYVNPDTKQRREVNQANIMEVFRAEALGITNANLAKIPRGDVYESEVKTESSKNNVNNNEVSDIISYDLKDEGIANFENSQLFQGDGYYFYYPANWYIGKKNIYPNWTYLSEELDYIENLNTPYYMNVDTYVLTYKVSRKVDPNLSDLEALKQGGYYLEGYKIIESEPFIINSVPALKEVLYAPKGSIVYGGRKTMENEYIILVTYRNGDTLYRIQFFNASSNPDYLKEEFSNIFKSFHLN